VSFVGENHHVTLWSFNTITKLTSHHCGGSPPGNGGLYVRTIEDAAIAPALSACGDAVSVGRMFIDTYRFSTPMKFDAGLFTPLKTDGNKVTKVTRAITELKETLNLPEEVDGFIFMTCYQRHSMGCRLCLCMCR